MNHLLCGALALLLALSAAQGQGIPSSAECQSRYDAIGANGLLVQLSSCQGGPTPQCCSQVQGLAGFPGSGQLAGCLCNADNLEATLAGIEGNTLARSAGVTRATVSNIFNACNIPSASRPGSCPGAAAAATPAAPVVGATTPSTAAATVTAPPPSPSSATAAAASSTAAAAAASPAPTPAPGTPGTSAAVTAPGTRVAVATPPPAAAAATATSAKAADDSLPARTGKWSTADPYGVKHPFATKWKEGGYQKWNYAAVLKPSGHHHGRKMK